jgi:hypothetical protein
MIFKQCKGLKITAIILSGIIVLAAINFSPMVRQMSVGMKKHQISGVTVFAVDDDLQEAADIVERINTSRDKLSRALAMADIDDVRIYVYPNQKILHIKTIGLAGLLLPDWYIGKNRSNAVLITSPANPGPAHSYESVVQAAVHEYVHVLTDSRNKDMSYWHKEAFALYLAEQVPDATALASHRDITFQEFSTGNAMEFAHCGGYNLAYHYIEYLKERYGWERVLELLDPNKSADDIFGRSLKQVFTEWKASI